SLSTGSKRRASPLFDKGRRRIVRPSQAQGIAIPSINISKLGTADSDGIFQHRLKNRFKLARRTADDPEHVGSRRLLLQRLPQLAQQPRVLDGDDGLRGEALYQRDLLVREWADFLAIDDDRTDQIVIL